MADGSSPAAWNNGVAYVRMMLSISASRINENFLSCAAAMLLYMLPANAIRTAKEMRL